MNELRLKLGDQVHWISQAGGYTKEKSGTVSEIIPAGEEPRARLKDHGLPRSHESYIVAVNQTNYWPRVSGLQVDSKVAAKVLPKRITKRPTTCPTCHGSGMVMIPIPDNT